MVGRIRIRRDPTAPALSIKKEPDNLYAVGDFVVFEHSKVAMAIGKICRVIAVRQDRSEGALSLHTYMLVRVLTGDAIPGTCPEHQLVLAPEFLLGNAVGYLDSILDALQCAMDDCAVGDTYTPTPEGSMVDFTAGNEDDADIEDDVEEDAEEVPRGRWQGD